MDHKIAAPTYHTQQAAVYFGQNMRYWRREVRGMTQDQLAGALGVCRQTVSAMESGTGSVALENWLSVWHAMGVLPALRANAQSATQARKVGEAKMREIVAAGEAARKAGGVAAQTGSEQCHG